MSPSQIHKTLDNLKDDNEKMKNNKYEISSKCLTRSTDSANGAIIRKLNSSSDSDDTKVLVQ